LRNQLPEAGAVTALCSELEISPLLARILLMRDLSGEPARQFLEGRLGDLPEPLLLPDMSIAIKRLEAAIRAGEKVVVHGDYDVDGMTGTALLVEGLQSFGAQVDFHIPLRLRDGYGLSATALREAAAAAAQVVVSVDCGVSAVEEALLARELGLDLIITDHHQPPPELPDALAVVNPQRSDSRFPYNSCWSPCAGNCVNPGGLLPGRNRTSEVSLTWSPSARLPTWCRCRASTAF
jgi:single-stranded-DNA-specific exonuclease